MTVDLKPGAASGTEGRRVRWVSRRIESAESGAPTRRWYWALVSGALVLGIWWAAAASGQWTPLLLPGPDDVAEAFRQSVTTHDGVRGMAGYLLWEDLWASLRRVLVALGWAIAAGIPFGVWLGISRFADRLLGPVVDFLKALPPLGYFPLLILWFGIEDTSKVWLLFLAAFPPIAVATAAGVRAVRQDRVNAALAFGASRFDLIRTVVLPSVAADAITGIRIASGFAWTTIVAAETSNGRPGIGGLAWASQKQLRADVAILAVIVIGLTALVIDTALRLTERKIAPWKGRA